MRSTAHDRLLEATTGAARGALEAYDAEELSGPERTAAVAATRACVRYLYDRLEPDQDDPDPGFAAGMEHVRDLVLQHMAPPERTEVDDIAGRESVQRLEKYTRAPVKCRWCAGRAVTLRRWDGTSGVYPSCGGDDCGLTEAQYEEKQCDVVADTEGANQ